MFKALMKINWSVMAGINDQFLGMFISIVNLGLIIGLQAVRYILGSFHESLHFQLLTGLKFIHEADYFWPIYISIVIFITMMALFIIIIQNAIGRYKEWKLTQNVQINLREISEGQNEENAEEEPNTTVHCFYNNAKYDVSLLNGKEIAITVTLFFSGLIFFYSVSRWARNNNDEQMYVYKWQVFREFFITFCKIFNPWTYLFAKKKKLVYG